jgi:hypothetical protein
MRTRGRHLAAQPPLRLLRRLHGLGRFVHAARFDARAALQSFQTGDLGALLADNLLQGGNFAAQFNHQRFKLWAAQSLKINRLLAEVEVANFL